MSKPKIKIIADNNEKDPLRFSTFENVVVGKDSLETADYTVAGHDLPGDDHSIIIERKKNCLELIGNLVSGWEVFERELQRMMKYRHRAIVVCGPNNFPYIYSSGMTKVSPNFAYCRLTDIIMDMNIPVIFAGSREDAEAIIYRMFVKVVKNVEQEN
jgi:ERCC4-type nuclease